MLLNILVALLASTTALAPALAGTPLSKRDAASDLIAKLQAAGSAVERNQILAAVDGNQSFAFDFANPPPTAVISSPAGKLIAATSKSAPFLTGINSALGLVIIEGCGLILPHLHPRADEFIIITQGEIFTQFIAEAGAVLVSNELKTLGSTLFPKGSIHLEYNPTCEPAAFVAAFNHNDPGLNFVAASLFSLEDQLVIESLGGDVVVSGADLASIRHALPQGLALSVESCVTKCGIKSQSKRSLKRIFGQ